ncbi:MAG: hypothetical protein P8Z71_14175 [Candidatus Sulfobium sp.]|jgi:hypothetical protein
MDLRLKDIEANAVKHALEEYLKNLEKSERVAGDKKGIKFEEEAVKTVIEKMKSLSGAPGL